MCNKNKYQNKIVIQKSFQYEVIFILKQHFKYKHIWGIVTHTAVSNVPWTLSLGGSNWLGSKKFILLFLKS